MKTKLLLPIIISLLAAFVSCSGVKNLTPADIDMPTSYMPGLEQDSTSIADLTWWEFYADSTLCRLMRLALDNNRDLLKLGQKKTLNIRSKCLSHGR